MSVPSDLALVDQGLNWRVNEFDRVFDSDDMAVFVAVDIVDHRGKGGRFTATGGPGNQDQALFQIGQSADRPWRAELVEGQLFRRYGPLRDLDHRLAEVLAA